MITEVTDEVVMGVVQSSSHKPNHLTKVINDFKKCLCIWALCNAFSVFSYRKCLCI